MIGFQIDMNVAHFKHDYLKKTLKYLAESGYDTILWEVENAIAWETCPECVRSEAYEKEEFREILDYCKELKLESIPLLQTLGHCEYVLKNEKYKKFAEDKNRIDQYCPLNPELLSFLIKWIDEYFDLFGKINIFHLGADEAFTLGTCDKCKVFTHNHSLSKLYVDYINKLASEISQRGSRPAVWADMLLHHNNNSNQLSKEIVLFDWMYDTRRGNGKVYIWGEGFVNFDQINNKSHGRFWKNLFPNGDEPGRIPETFYSADYLAEQGFDVVTCPASSCFGDSVFAPRIYYHLTNIYDSFKKGLSSGLKGSVMTSWTAHLFPYELQRACIELPGYLNANKESSIDEYQDWFLKKEYGIVDKALFKAYGLLAKPCLFSECCSLGYSKAVIPVEKDYVANKIKSFAESSEALNLLNQCIERAEEYEESLNLMHQFSKQIKKGDGILEFWILAAENLKCRARSAEFLLKCESLKLSSKLIPADLLENGKRLLVETKRLRKELDCRMSDIILPIRREFILKWIYDSMEYAMENYQD